MTAHAFEPDPLSLQGDCGFCGLPHPDYGLNTEPAFPDIPQVTPSCPGCPHFRHDGECSAVVSWRPETPCPCAERAA